MTAAREGDGVGSEAAFAVLMIVLSVVIFLAIRDSEQPES
ncbi:MAG: hypothetical protein A07HB70_00468 [uncultured archaeon A07HB70]|jgi:hypothetical protein|nr:MAG: hypothetical protein A07HB70_00468 [uncultured archaeon A07HB70]